MDGPLHRRCPDGIILNIRLTPKSSRDGFSGTWSGPAGKFIQARVRAVPEDGQANAALIGLLASGLRVPKSSISLASGSTARLKGLLIAGEVSELERRLSAWLESIA